MTFKEMIVKGLYDGTVKLIRTPLTPCIACQIGKDWFQFIESKEEKLPPDEIYKLYTKEELAKMIYSTLQDREEVEIKYNLFNRAEYCKTFLEEKYATPIIQWHYMAKEPPKKTGYYQVAVEPGVILTNRFANKDGKEHLKKCGNSYPAVCFWDGHMWDNKLSLEIDDASGAIGENETIYAWTDVFSSDIPDVICPDKPVTINLSDYHMTEAQLKAFLNDYKETYEYESEMRGWTGSKDKGAYRSENISR